MSTPPRFSSRLLALLLTAIGASCSTAPPPADSGNAELDADEAAHFPAYARAQGERFQAIGAGWAAQVQAGIEAGQYRLRPSAAGLVAGNPRHGINLRAEGGEVEFSGVGGWSFTLSTVGLEDADGARAVEPGEAQLGDCAGAGLKDERGACLARLELPRAGLDEWWSNSPAGFEQGFSLPDGAGEVSIALALDGAVATQVSDQEVTLQVEGGPALRYHGLAAWDADGVELSTRMEVRDNGLALVIDTDGARFPVDVDPILSASPDITLEKDQANASFGLSVAIVGDVNNDGFDDVVVGAPDYDNGQTDEGAAFLYLGARSGPSTTASWTVESNEADAVMGHVVAGAGDVNGDGFADVVVTAPYGTSTEQGTAYVYYGSSSGLSTTASWSWSSGQADAHLGHWQNAASSAGDVNGDGYDDLLLGAHYYDDPTTNEGKAWVFLGSATGLATSAVWTVGGDSSSAELGRCVAEVGDVNNDGYDDVAVASPRYTNGSSEEGRVQVYHGSSTGPKTTVAFAVEPNKSNAHYGESVDGAGDVNGDGYDDLIVGAPGYANGSTAEGAVFVYHGSSTGLKTSSSWTVECNQSNCSMGSAVAGMGDANFDGYDDVVIGASAYNSSTYSDEGLVQVYLGSASGLLSTIEWSDTSGQRSSDFGVSLASGGDLNGDRSPDLVVGADTYDNGSTDEGVAFIYLSHGDSDGDGDPDALDCSDYDPTVYTGAPEIVGDGIDQDCDGGDTCYVDADSDGYRNTNTSLTVSSADLDCNDAGEGAASEPATDCDDTNAAVNPGAAEIVGDGIDQNCDSGDTCYVDADGDGYRPTDTSLTTTSADLDCTDAGEGAAALPATDCDDSSALAHPGGTEITADGIDEDCDGTETCYVDADSDDYRNVDTTLLVTSTDPDCADAGEGAAAEPATDCLDTDATVHPGAPELPMDGIDQDCDGNDACYADLDSDGYRDTDTSIAVASADGDCSDPGEGDPSEPATDCDDSAATIHPGATEVLADGIDQDCDGGDTCYVDADSDSHRNIDTTLSVTSADLDCADAGEGAASEPSDDCDDSDATIFPGATELVADGIDQDCDSGDVCYVDGDSDGYRNTNTSLTVASGDLDCADAGEGAAAEPATDCNDASASVHPGATETVGDGIDQDCDSGDVCYADADLDTYRDVDTTATVASADLDCTDAGEKSASAPAVDCDDSDATVHPGATEGIADGVDQDCDGGETCYVDADSDDYRNTNTALTTASADTDCADAGEGAAAEPATDCDDGDASIYPGAPETPGDSVDQDCDGTDSCYADVDNDGYRDADAAATVPSADADCNDAGEAGLTDPAVDCDDADATVYPGAAEVIADGIDQDCDGQETCYVDADDDAYRDEDTSLTTTSADADCDDSGEGAAVEPATDCDDAVSTTNPGAPEICNGVDDDCDGSIDEDAVDMVLWYVDGDGDSYGGGDAVGEGCFPPAGYSEENNDCDDTDATINPGASETPYDGIDQDCDGFDLVDVDGDGAASTVAGGTDCWDMSTSTYSGAPELADGVDNDCDGTVDEGTSAYDDDGDGFTEAAGDCDDADAATSPGALEVEDGLDNDCDGLVDEGTSAYDDDGDGYAEEAGDCHDGDPSTFPGAPELADGVDNDCDGVVDEGTTAYDDDGDGFTEAAGDCDDADASVSPAGVEVADGVDQDCDGIIDNNTEYSDDDGDGYAEVDGDCNDGAATVHPDAEEALNGVDDDCDGIIDNSADISDDDSDGYSEMDGDCDDADPATHPQTTETPDGLDNDCDGLTDEGTEAYDDDGDGYAEADGDCDDTTASVSPAMADDCTIAGVDNDCDGEMDEECGLLNNAGKGAGGCGCSTPGGEASGAPAALLALLGLAAARGRRRRSGFFAGLAALIGVGCTSESNVHEKEAEVYLEADASYLDFGSITVGGEGSASFVLSNLGNGPTNITAISFEPPGPTADPSFVFPTILDVDPPVTIPLVYGPTAVGLYEGEMVLNTDSEMAPELRLPAYGVGVELHATWVPALVDFGAVEGEASRSVLLANEGAAVIHLASLNLDNADFLLAADPGAVALLPGETVAVEVATSASEEARGTLTAIFAEGGEVGLPLVANSCASAPVDEDADGWSTCGGDCDDGDATVYPGATELPDEVDQDCDGIVDEGTINYDDDGDGFAEVEGDCDDGDVQVFPGSTADLPGVDADCDGVIDDDPDGDGYDSSVDCAPADASVHPGAPEVADGVDQDCDGLIDEGTNVYDDDGDGMSEVLGDCDDTDATVYLGAPELPDGIDNDCDGLTDEGTSRSDDDHDGFTEDGGDCDDTTAAISPAVWDVAGDGVDADCDGVDG